MRGAARPRAVPAVQKAVHPARGGAHERVGVLSPVRRGRGSAIRAVPGDARGGGGGRRRSPVQRVMRRPRRRQLCRMCRRRRRRPFGFRIWTPVASLAADGVTRFRCNQMMRTSSRYMVQTGVVGRGRRSRPRVRPDAHFPLMLAKYACSLARVCQCQFCDGGGVASRVSGGVRWGYFRRSSSWCAGGSGPGGQRTFHTAPATRPRPRPMAISVPT